MHLQKCLTFGVHINFVKFERYQKQFHFLIDNNIETTGQLNDVKQNAEDKIAELTLKRTRLYSKPDTKNEIYDINTEYAIIYWKMQSVFKFVIIGHLNLMTKLKGRTEIETEINFHDRIVYIQKI